jgi:hypothetical protein
MLLIVRTVCHVIPNIVRIAMLQVRESTVPGIGAVHALRVAGTNIMVELCRSFAIAPVVT